jgi:hypothetical protein
MPEHIVEYSIDPAQQVLQDKHCLRINVKSNTKQLGTFDVWNSGPLYYLRGKKKPIEFTWKQFDQLMKDYAEGK